MISHQGLVRTFPSSKSQAFPWALKQGLIRLNIGVAEVDNTIKFRAFL